MIPAVDRAKQLAATYGFHVFPLVPNSKVPAIKDFPNRASCDPLKIEELFENQPSDANVGISTTKFNGGSALAVVDVDVKADRDGFKTMEELESIGHEFPPTFAVETPSGGLHLFYQVPKPLKQGTNVLGPGIDIRSRGGYVVAVGSVINERRYILKSDNKIVGANRYTIEKCEEKPWIEDNGLLAGSKHGPIVAGKETSHLRGREYLEKLEPSHDGSRNEDCYKAAAKLKDFGCDRIAAVELLAAHWKCEPKLDAGEIEHCVNSAFTYGKNRPGSNTAEAAFQDPLPVPGEKKKRKLTLIKFKDCKTDLNQPYLVEDLLLPGGMSVLYGESNTGKSFLAADIGFHIALGKEWHTRKVTRGGVVYIAAESGSSFERRVNAFRIGNNLGDLDVPFYLCPNQINLLDSKGDADSIVEMCEGVDPVLVVIDTLARAMSGGNENQSDHMGAFITNVDTIREKLKTHVMVVHHSGKDQMKGARGHSSLRAATDTEIEIVRGIATVKKQRDMEFVKPIGFKLKQVVIGHNPQGKAFTSCIVEPSIVIDPKTFDRPKLTGYCELLFSAASDLALSTTIVPPENWGDVNALLINEEFLQSEFKRRLPPEMKDRSKERSFERTLKKLIVDDYLGQRDGYVWIKE